ncbi:MAG: amidohydrolase family protein [Planctomycetes bacterium]|nr:amidohydrolase family protein [Planctomycetota bacterium]
MLPEKIIDMHTHPGYPVGELGKILDYMDERGIEKIVSLGASKGPEYNDRILKLREMAPERIIGGPCVDPRDPGALDELKRCHDKGCRILKLFPNFGFYPDEAQFVPFFEEVARMGFGILSHCGWLGAKRLSSVKYARPMRFEELFRRFPDTLFIMAHMGGISGFIEGIMYTTRTPNVYLDTTPGHSHWVFKHAGEMVRGMPVERLLLGTDGISPPSKDWDASKQYELIASEIDDLGWGEHLEDIYYNNAARVIEKYKLLP